MTPTVYIRMLRRILKFDLETRIQNEPKVNKMCLYVNNAVKFN